MEKDKAKKPDLSGLRITVNELGEIVQNIGTEQIVEFLNENTTDLKLNEHPDFQKTATPEPDAK